jgi:HSP20 family protein
MALFTFSRELDPVPAVNVFRAGEDVVIRIEVPGFAPENLSIESRGQTLTISGKRTEEPAAEGTYHRRERFAGEFSRSLQLPRDVDPSLAVASCKHGVLTLRVPARAEAKPRQIAVSAS